MVSKGEDKKALPQANHSSVLHCKAKDDDDEGGNVFLLLVMDCMGCACLICAFFNLQVYHYPTSARPRFQRF